MPAATTPDGDEAEPTRRSYDSPVRRAKAAETRERILDAGVVLAHSLDRWDWRSLTVRAVAERAGVNERTVYRHFGSEREVRDAVMRRLEQEAGDPLGDLRLEDLPAVATRVFDYLTSFAASVPQASDPTLAAVDARRREALVTAVAEATAGWSERDRVMAAGLLDVLWSLPAFARLLSAWGLEPEDAGAAMTGAISLVVDAIASGEPPWPRKP